MKQKSYWVTFRKSAPVGAEVFVCGEFNGWNAASNPLEDVTGKGDFEVRISLPAGVYRYKFLVNGIWCLDDSNGEFTMSDFGRYDNLLEVSGRTMRVK